MTLDHISSLIRQRRSVFPPQYNAMPIAKETVQQILENANWAPTHKLTEPWRFKVLMGEAKNRLSQYLADFYTQNTPADQFSEMKLKKMQSNPIKAACVIAICMKRHQQDIVEWEEIAAVSCAVQNMYLSCTAAGIGCFWSTPPAALAAKDYLGLADDERCLGFFYMGYYDSAIPDSKRGNIEEKVEWME